MVSSGKLDETIKRIPHPYENNTPYADAKPLNKCQ